MYCVGVPSIIEAAFVSSVDAVAKSIAASIAAFWSALLELLMSSLRKQESIMIPPRGGLLSSLFGSSYHDSNC